MGLPNNQLLLQEIIDCKAKGVVSDLLNSMIHDVIDYVAKRQNFLKCKELPQLKAYAHAMMLTSWHKFNPDKSSNPNAFFYTCIWGSFCHKLSHIKHERKMMIHKAFTVRP